MPACMGTLCQGAAETPLQGPGEQWGVRQASSSGPLLTCPHHLSPAHLNPHPSSDAEWPWGQQ